MSMDIEKICRTCLALSGPLLSIYDGGTGGSGCLADMLREFTNTKPKPNDSLPEKVCLTCISEINRCYSFKLKCENSNRTLRQLLPNAVVEEPVSEKKATLANAAVQTDLSPTATAHTQTVEEEEKPKQNRRQLQTDLKSPRGSPELTKSHTQRKLKEEKEFQLHLQEDEFVVCDDKVENAKAKGANHTNRSAAVKVERSQASPTTTSQLPPAKRIRSSVHAARLHSSEEANGSHEFVLELAGTSGDNDSSNGREYYVQSAQQEEASEGIVDVSSTGQYDYLDEEHVEDEGDEKANIDTVVYREVQCGDYVYAEVPADGSSTTMVICPTTTSTTSTSTDYSYTIYSNDDGEEDIALHAQQSQSTEATTVSARSVLTKDEHQCPHCIMTFVSVKNLRRHLAKRHNVVVESEPPERVGKLPKKMLQELQIEVEQVDEQMAERVTPPLTTPSKSVQRVSRGNGAAETCLKNTLRVSSPSVSESLLTNLKYFCERCNAGFAARKTLNYHLKLNTCTAKTYKCKTCERIFMTRENLEAHVATHTTQQTCIECSKVCGSMEELSQHMIDEHKRKARNQCNLCKKVFTMKTSLMDHMRIHSGEKPFLCKVCGKSFRQNSNLRQHLMRHANEKNFKCDECPNSYVTKAELFSHKRTHTGDHPFKCEVCNACFTSSSSLLKHRRKHTGERPYACDFCPMRFTALNVLKNHRRTHTGEKPYKCEHCDKQFTQKGDCQMHQRTHGERDFSCYCGAKFAKTSLLRMHMRTHDQRALGGDKKGDDASEMNEDGDASAVSSMQITLLEDEDEDTHLVAVATQQSEGDQVIRSPDQVPEQRLRRQPNDEELMEIATEDVC